jgi:hypothetical protein
VLDEGKIAAPVAVDAGGPQLVPDAGDATEDVADSPKTHTWFEVAVTPSSITEAVADSRGPSTSVWGVVVR